ncbi:hypothetical protein PG985_002884 [Apiospora marii]|uniref:uncharacterized protein n=1 Tax=Apiospora marii TaxID=335849 RepID=UPI00312FD714
MLMTISRVSRPSTPRSCANTFCGMLSITADPKPLEQGDGSDGNGGFSRIEADMEDDGALLHSQLQAGTDQDLVPNPPPRAAARNDRAQQACFVAPTTADRKKMGA